VAEGGAYHWGRCGEPQEAWTFEDGYLVGSTDLPDARYMQGDLDGSGLVDWLDLEDLLNYWVTRCREGEWCDGRDLNRNGKVTLEDFAILASQWFESCP
jgi:hypothetical protein